MFPFWLLLIAALFAFLAIRRPAVRSPLFSPQILAIAAAAISCVALLGLLATSSFWRDSMEVAWLGAENTSTEQPLQIGGNRQEAVVGWPNGAFGPQLTFRPGAEGTAVEIRNGLGFVKGPDGDYLNGDALFLKQPLEAGDFRVALERRYLIRRQITVRTAAGETIAEIPISRGRRDRVHALDLLLSPAAIRLRSENRADVADQLERWAAPLRLLVPAERNLPFLRALFSIGAEVRLLSFHKAYNAIIPANSRFSVHWASSTIAATLDSTNGNPRILFDPPWRTATPVPPLPQGADTRILTVTSRALPGDYAFLLPFADGLSDTRYQLKIRNNKFEVPELAASSENPNPYLRRGQIEVSSLPWDEVLGHETVPAGRYLLHFALVKDVPRISNIVICLGLALLNFGAGLVLCLRRMRKGDRWRLAALAVAVWELLLFRCALALRYSTDPAHLDGLAIGGVTTALCGLAAVPSLILLAAPLWRDQYLPDMQARRTIARLLTGYALWLALTAFIEAFLVKSLWPNSPAAYSPVGTFMSAFVWAGIAALLIFGWWLALTFLYILHPDSRQRLPAGVEQRYGHYLSRGFEFFSGLLRLFHTAAVRTGGKLWTSMQDRDRFGRRPSQARATNWSFRKWYLLVVGSAASLLAGCFLVLQVTGGGAAKHIQEIGAPLLLCWIPACLLLAAARVFPPGGDQPIRWPGAVLLIFTIFGLSVFLFPIAVHDAGGIMSTLSVFVPVAVILVAARRAWPISYTPLIVLVLFVVAASVAYLNFQVFLGPLGKIGSTPSARILAWKEGLSVQEKLFPYAFVGEKNGRAVPVSFRRLSDAIEHSHENRMMAHEGGYTGLGFANAPSRRSHVRQDTIQYDSTFSFFVLGEYGLLGGLSLLLIYAIPLCLVLASGRQIFDAGHGFAAVIASSLLLCALAHGAMNLGQLPFTGRNLPLESVNSTSDLVLWTVLLALCVQGMLWRVTGDDMVLHRDARESLLSGSAAAEQGREPRGNYRMLALMLGGLPALLFAMIAVAGVRTVRDESLLDGFNWTRLLETVNRLSASGDIYFDAKEKKIRYRPESGISPDMLIGQEIARFNAMPESERLHGASPADLESARRRLIEQRCAVSRNQPVTNAMELLRDARSLRCYDAFLSELRAASGDEQPSRRPSLFDIPDPDEYADEQNQVAYAEPIYTIRGNPDFNTQVDFGAGPTPVRMSSVTLRDGARGTYLVRGDSFEIALPDRPASARESSSFILQDYRGSLRPADGAVSSGPRSTMYLRFFSGKGRRGGSIRTLRFGTWEVREDGIYFRREDLEAELRKKGKSAFQALAKSRFVKIEPGDLLRTPGKLTPNLQPSFSILHSSAGSLIGPAWAHGEWFLTYKPDPNLPWLKYIAAGARKLDARAAQNSDVPRLTALSLDPALQAAAQDFAASAGRERHRQLLAGRGSNPREALPPRVALSMVDLPSGEVLALGGWPRMNASRDWLAGDDGLTPGVDWIERKAPKTLRRRYGGDRNFDRMLMGSATKPVFALAAVAVHKEIDSQLAVRGPGGEDAEVFGIPVEPPWHVQGSGGWVDFSSYLARSDNRYHIRLGFAALAEIGPRVSIATVEQKSPSSYESLDGGKEPCRCFPRFPDGILFNHGTPDKIANLDKTLFADRLHALLRVGISRQEPSRRYSFWTANEADDNRDAGVWLPAELRALTPEPPELDLDVLWPAKPRTFVSVLLGGATNMWSNVEFATAFASAATGIPFTPHITHGAKPQTTRERFLEPARRLRPGLRAVIASPEGTAYSSMSAEARRFLLGLPGVEVYGKTGTLSEAQGKPQTSRLVLALVKRSGDSVRRGLAISFVIERGYTGLGAKLLGDFILQNRSRIEDQLR